MKNHINVYPICDKPIENCWCENCLKGVNSKMVSGIDDKKNEEYIEKLLNECGITVIKPKKGIWKKIKGLFLK